MLMDAFIGEIRAFANSWCPDGWLPCEGQRVSIPQYQILFAIIGGRFGDSDYRTYFTLPDLTGKAMVSAGQRGSSPFFLNVGQSYGSEGIPLSYNQMASHSHTFGAVVGGDNNARLSTADNSTSRLSNFLYWKPDGTGPLAAPGYLDQPQNPVALNPNTLSPSGGDTQGICHAHENRSPYLVINYYICAIDGVFPPQP